MYVEVPGVVVLIVAGAHVPVTPFVDVVGSGGAVLFWHNGPICVNVAVTLLVTTIFMVAAAAHCPTAGVKV